MKVKFLFRSFLYDERGSAESSLVLIPLLLLFLGGIQLIQITHSRNMLMLETQDYVTQQSISGEIDGAVQSHQVETLDNSKVALLTRTAQKSILPLTPWFDAISRGLNRIKVVGISIIESSP